MTPAPTRTLSFPTARRPLRCARVRPVQRCRQGARCPAARHRHRQRALGYRRADRRFCRPPGNHPRLLGLPGRTLCPALPGQRLPRSSPNGRAADPAAGLPVVEDAERGLDHGAWVPLRLMFPEADVPVIPLSIQSHGGPQQAWRTGSGAGAARAKGFLVIASGNVTHNLRDYQRAARNGGQTPAYVRQFTDWMADRLQLTTFAALLDYRRPGTGRRAGPPER
jgi:hypothetical protein